MTLTTTPQEIANSDNGILIFPATFKYGFGATHTTQNRKRKKSTNLPFNYAGGFGNVFVWKESAEENSEIKLVLAV